MLASAKSLDGPDLAGRQRREPQRPPAPRCAPREPRPRPLPLGGAAPRGSRRARPARHPLGDRGRRERPALPARRNKVGDRRITHSVSLSAIRPFVSAISGLIDAIASITLRSRIVPRGIFGAGPVLSEG